MRRRSRDAGPGIYKHLGAIGRSVVLIGERDGDKVSVGYLTGPRLGEVHAVAVGLLAHWRPAGSTYLRKELRTIESRLAAGDIEEARRLLHVLERELDGGLPMKGLTPRTR